MEKIYRAAKYIRTSCPDDELQYRDSAVNQNKLIDTFVQTHPEIIVISEKIDDGYSGLFLDRPAFVELIKEIEAGVINCVIVKDLSRLSRDYIETGRYLRDFFPAHGVRFISIDDHIDSIVLDGFEKTIATIKSIFCEQYSHDVSVKTRSSLDAKRKQGKYVGATPIYGYQKSSDNKHRLVPDPNTSEVVHSIFLMKLQGMSSVAIASALNKSGKPSPLSYKRQNGLPCPSGGYADKNNARWSATTVLRILQDENYTGTLVQGRQRSYSYKTKTFYYLDESEWIKIENAHPAIIPSSDYDAVQRALAIDTRTAPGHDRVHIFSGILICGCCGGGMTRRTMISKGHPYIYYYCPTGKRSGCHAAGVISEKELLYIVTQRVKERIAHIKKLSDCITETQIEDVLRNERAGKISDCDMKIRDCNKYKLCLNGSKKDGVIDDSDFQILRNFYDAEIALLDSEISVLYKELYSSDSVTARNMEWKQSFLQFSNMEELDRVAVIKMIRNIRILVTKEVIVNFIYQSEYEQLVRCSRQGGHAGGEKEPQTK